MRVGDLHVLPLLDGEVKVAPTAAYPTTSDGDWVAHRRWLTHDGYLEMPIGCFLLRTADRGASLGAGERVILIDAGLGPYSRAVPSPNGVGTAGYFHGGCLLEELEAIGVRVTQVTDVVLSHLHLDHVGWTTQKGSIVFPNATYRCHAADWEHFVGDGDTDPAGRLRGLEGHLELWEGETTLAPGLDTLPTPGHTPGHTAFVVSSDDERVLLLGDAIHCPAELTESEWDGMSDVDPVLARRTREMLLSELESTATPAAGAHLPGLQFGRVLRGQGKRYWAP